MLEKKLAPVIQAENQAIQALSPQERQQLLALTRKYVGLCLETFNAL